VPPDARTDRTEFLDVTDPANPRLLWTFGPDQVDGESHNGDIVDARRTYFPSAGVGAPGLRIYDLGRCWASDRPRRANLFRGDPVKLWEASPYRDGRPVGAPFTHTHDITVYPDHPSRGARGARHRAAGRGPQRRRRRRHRQRVRDRRHRSDRARGPRPLAARARRRPPPIRYHHSAQLLDGDPSVMLVTDEDMHNGCGGAGGVVAVRLTSDLRDATEVSEWFIPLGTPATVCSVHVFSSEGSRVSFGAYNAGLQVVDYSDPSAPGASATTSPRARRPGVPRSTRATSTWGT
jgi:hypothetical protein